MASRRRSVSNRSRRESIKNVSGRSRNKDIVIENLTEDLENTQRFKDLDNLKINEAELVFENEIEKNLENLEHINITVRRPLDESHKICVVAGFVMKKLPRYNPMANITLYSSLNSQNSEFEKFHQYQRLKVIQKPKVMAKVHLEKLNTFNIKNDDTYNCLENWKKKMAERRKQKNSLSNRLHQSVESLLMSKSSIAFTECKQQDNLLEVIFPSFQSGRGAPLIRSIWSEKEVTNQNLQIQRIKLKPETSLDLKSVGYAEKIILEMGESRNENKSVRKQNDKEHILNKEENKIFYRNHLYNPPQFKDLLILGKAISNINEHSLKSEETINSQDFEYSVLQSQVTMDKNGPELIINNEICLGKLYEYNNEAYENLIKVDFLVNSTKKMNTKEITFNNCGACTIRYTWKKIEMERFLRRDDHKVTFYFKINKGIILPNSIFKLPIIFKSQNPGFFDEKWEFITKPVVSDKKIVFHFYAIAITSDSMYIQREIIKDDLSCFRTQKIIAEIIEEIFKYVTSVKKKDEPVEEVSVEYSKEEIFKRLNEADIWKHDLIEEIKAFNEAVFKDQWDLSLHILKEKLFKIENSEKDEYLSLISNFHSLCQNISVPDSNIYKMSQGPLSSLNDYNIICSGHLRLTIDKSVECMYRLAQGLGIEQYIFHVKSDYNFDSNIIPNNEDNKIVLKGTKNIEKPLKIPVEIKFTDNKRINDLEDSEIILRKEKFRRRSEVIIRVIVSRMFDQIDELLK